MRSDRRRFLGLAGFTAGLAVAPGWVRQALASEGEGCCKDSPDRAALMAAWKRARAHGRPLLALVIPEKDYGEGYNRGRAWGALFNHGTPAQLAPLALCEIIATPHKALKAIAPQVGDKEAMAVLIHTDSVPASVRRLDGPMAALPNTGHPRLSDGKTSWEEMQRKEVEAVDTRIELVARQFQDLLSLKSDLDRYVDQASATLSPTGLQSLSELLAAGGDLTEAQAESGAALVLRAALAAEGVERAHWETTLAEVVHRRMKNNTTPGGVLWAKSGGCGTQIEYPPEPEPEVGPDGQVRFSRRMVVVGCGMGHVPAKSRRFLHFYVDENEW